MKFPKPRRHLKYGNKRTELAGRSFDSKGEAELYLHFLADPKISDIKQQVSIYLTDARIQYKCDYTYIRDGQTVYAEYKGFETPVWRIKRRLWIHYGPGTLEVYNKGPRLKEILIPKGAH